MAKIFVSYRREDSADVTGRIGDRLRESFGGDQIFTDVDNIPLGVDFRTHLENEVGQCNVLLAIIGTDWLSAMNSDGKKRLNDPTDFVRIEIESALRRDIPVIPLLVRGAIMPETSELPESLHDLVFRNAQNIRPDPDFKNDASRLVQNLAQHFQPESSEPFQQEKPSLEEDELPIEELARRQRIRTKQELKRVRGEKKQQAIKWGRTCIGFIRLIGIYIAFGIASTITHPNKLGEVGLLGALPSIVSFGVVTFLFWKVSSILVWRCIDRWLNP